MSTSETSSWPRTDSCGPVPLPPPEVEPGLSLHSSTSHYSVLEISGEGCFGKVARCRNLATEEAVAVKFVKNKSHTEAEVSMLEAISVLDLDKANVLKFLEQFDHQGLTCLVFELLDRSLQDWFRETEWSPMYLDCIRPIAKQLFVALDALTAVGILHTDIKPDNIMLVDMQDQPLRVKLIDFGNALPAAAVHPGMAVQPLAYRAPEIVLGLPFTAAIDVWGVGCVLAFLYLARHLLWFASEYQLMKAIVQLVGHPEDHLLRAGMFTQRFYLEEKAADGPTWRLMTEEEYAAANYVMPEELNSTTHLLSSLEDLVDIYDKEEEAEYEDRLVFVDLLRQLLHVDGDQRISPYQALQHPFISMEHLTKTPDSRTHLATSQAFMNKPWISDGDKLPVSHQEDPDVWSTDGAQGEDIRGDDAAAGPSDAEVHRWSSEHLAARSSEGAEPPGFAPDISSSSGRPRKWFSRIRRFFKRITSPFCCCWRP